MMAGYQPVSVTSERRIVPLERFGIRYISMALFINDETPVIWRGPMVTKLETEFPFGVQWVHLKFAGAGFTARHRRRPTHYH